MPGPHIASPNVPSTVRAPWNTAPVAEIPLREVFDATFLRENCGVERIEHLFAKAGLVPAEAVDREFLRALGRGTLDQIADEFTDHGTWAEFEAAAKAAWAMKNGRV